MKPADHSGELEQVMAYVDGALDAETVQKVRLHIAGCHTCRQAEQDLRVVSERLQSWDAGAVPETLRTPAAATAKISSSPFLAWMSTRRALLATAAGVLLLLIGFSATQRQRKPAAEEVMTIALGGAESAPAAPIKDHEDAAQSLHADARLRGRNERMAGEPPPAPPAPARQGPLIVRNARFTIVASDFDSARAEIERTVQRMGGFIGQMEAQGAPGSTRRVTATLRIPAARLDEAVAALRRLGQVVGEAQDGEDVTQQSADLDTRLENARVSEKRLRDILAQRTGKLADVLDVEREIARVRGEIEAMESQRRSLDRRVTYATVSVTLTEDRKSEVSLGPVPVSRRLRNAVVEGWTNAIASGVDVLLLAASVGPTLVLWGVILLPAAFLARRRLFRAG